MNILQFNKYMAIFQEVLPSNLSQKKAINNLYFSYLPIKNMKQII